MEKLNIAELLKDCPTGMELDCPMYENLYFDRVNEDTVFPILAYTINNSNRTIVLFTKHGCYNRHSNAKCVIFPKGKTTWEGFVPPIQFKDGDIVHVDCGGTHKYISILKQIKDMVYVYGLYLIQNDEFYIHEALCEASTAEIRLATEKEKQKLFQAIKDNGYKWNPETKTLEKLPKFKVGDKIRCKTYPIFVFTITNIIKDKYECDKPFVLRFTDQDDYELVPNKFDITTLKPFDKVLVRCSSLEKWRIQLFEKYDKTCKFPFFCMGHTKYEQCIPYEGNQHLLDTTNDCNDFYKIWEK